MMTRILGKRGLRALVVTNALAIVLTSVTPAAFAQSSPYQTAPIPGQPLGQTAPGQPLPGQQPPASQTGAGPVINAGVPGDLGGFDQPWPRQVQMNGQALTVYQPQVEAWDGNVLELKAAVGVNVEAQNQADQHFGQVFLTARSDVDKERGAVWLSDVRVTRVLLPTAPQRAGEIEQALESSSGGGVVARVIALDQLQSSLAIAKAQRSADLQIDVLNDAPQIILSQEASVLVLMDGEPVLREVAPNLQRVVNTNVLLLREGSSGRYFLRVAGFWATTPDLNSPWTIAYESQPVFDQIKQQALNEGGVDLLDDDDKPGPYNVLPAIYVADRPTELLQTDGAPQFVPVDGTQLLYVQNTAGDIFLDTVTQEHFVLISGRWFRARGLEGPWAYVDGQNLPADFRRIPEAHPKGVVLVSIPGTPQAQEAAIANTIPQTATVDRQSASFDPYYDGQPQFAPVEGTGLQYAQNAPVPIIRVDPNSYYAVENGVWFTAPAPTGPWLVATVVPPVIYTIPPSSPVYYATYVRVYRATPRYVYVGYTPGYFGTYVSRRGTVVYGSGYRYKPWVGQTYYARPATYGAGVGFAAGSFIGFAAGLATAAIIGEQFWGPHYDGRRDRRDDRRDNRSWDRRDFGAGRSVVRGPEPGRGGPGGNVRASAGRDVVVNYQTNVYNTWSNKTVVRTTNVQPATAPATLRERQRRVDDLRQSSQQNRERGAERRATSAPGGAPGAAGAPGNRAAPTPNVQPDRGQARDQNRDRDQGPDDRGRDNRGRDNPGRDNARDNRGRPPQAAPTVVTPAPATPAPAAQAPARPQPQRPQDNRGRDANQGRDNPGRPPQAAPAAPVAAPPAATPPAAARPATPAVNNDAARRQQQENAARIQAEQQRRTQENAARAQADRARRQREESARAQRQQQENAVRSQRQQQENAARAQADQARRQQEESARAQRQQQENATRAQRQQQENAARAQAEQTRRAQENAARQADQARRQQENAAKAQAEQARRAQENSARQQAEQARRQQQAAPPQAAPQAAPPQAQPGPQGGRPQQGGGGGRPDRGRDRKQND